MKGDGSPARAVGRLLKDQREELGLSLSDVGQRLRIRRPYIEAIEEGRFEELPGAAYIPAFLRAYAIHLGLDPEKVLTAYHSTGAAPIKRPTALPADFPLAERRKPYGLAVITVLLVIAAGYGVWHFMPRESQVVAQKVPPVPDRLLASRPSEPAAAPSTNETRAAQPQTPSSTQAQAAPAPAEMWPLPKTDAAAPSTVVETPLLTTQTPAAPAVAAAPAPATPVVVPQAAPPPPVQVVPPPASTVGQAQAAQPRIDVLRGTPPAAEEARAVPVPAPEDASKPVVRDTPIGVRVDSWVELRAPNGDVLAQTYVRAGESYTIPAGIAFRIINAR